MYLRARSTDSAPSPDGRELYEMIVRELPDCHESTIASLADSARVRTVNRGGLILGQGERVALTLMVDGHSIARRTTSDGQHLISAVYPPGRLLGFSGIAPILSAAELIALTDCRIASWPGLKVRALAAADPGLGLAAVDALAASVHERMERAEWFLHQDARRRVMRILAAHRDLFFEEPALLDRTHLPGLVGTSREMTGRVLRYLEREGTVARVGRVGLRLLRPDRLDAGPT
jgi:CRP-like cAMP-binding protein